DHGGPFSGTHRREGGGADAAARPARTPAVQQSAGLQGAGPSACGAKPDARRYRRNESQEHEECLIMAETMQSLDQLGALKPAAPEAPKYVQKLDKQGRAYATGKRKNAVARVWIKPGSGKILVNTRAVEVFFARPVLRMLIQQPLIASNRATQF